MDDRVRLVVSPNRRRRVLTVRWNAEYLLGRLVCLLSLTSQGAPKGQVFDALLLFEQPQELMSRLDRAHVAYNHEIFPSYIMDSLAHPIPRITPRYEDALGLGISKGLISVEKRIYGPVFCLTDSGKALARTLMAFHPGDAALAELAVGMTRTS